MPPAERFNTFESRPSRLIPQPHPSSLIPRSRLPRLYPRTNSGWLYALLTTIPNVFYINTALIAAYFLERFFNWQIAAIGLVCLAIAYGLCRIIVCAVCFIRRRFEKS